MRQKTMVKLAGILMGIVVFVTLVTLFMMYRLAISWQSEHLREMVKSQARLMEEGFRSDRVRFTRQGKNAGEAFDYTLKRLQEAHKNYEGFGESGEYALAKRDGNKIHFLFTLRNDTIKTENKIIPFQKGIAEPMQQALEGKSGVMTGYDYRGVRVIAAYEPLHVNGQTAIVAKIDLREVESPLIYIGLSVIGISLLLVLGGVFLIFRVTGPLLQRLQKSESHYKTLIHTIPEIITEVDRDKRIVWLNPAGEKFFGSNAVGKEANTFFIGEQLTYGVVDLVFQGEEDIVYVESLQRRKDGEERLLAWYCGGLHNERGEITGAFSTARDITETRASYGRLKKVNRLLRIISECNKILVRSTEEEALLNEIVRLMHKEGNYISVFVAVEDEGTTRVLAAAGKCDKEGLTEYLNDPKSDISIKTVVQSLSIYIGRGEDQAVLKRFCPQSDIDANYSYGLFPFEIDNVPLVIVFCTDRLDVFNDEEIHLIEELTGDLTYGILAIRNLEKNRENQQHLRTLNLRYKIASEVSGTAAWEMWPQTGHFFSDNGLKRLLGYLPEELGEDFKEWLAILYPDDRKKVEAIITKMAEGDMGQHTLEARFIQKGGSYRWYLLTGSRIDIDKDEWHIYGAVTDITDLKAAEIALKESETRYHTLFDNIQEGVMIVDTSAYVRFANHIALAMFETDSMVGKQLDISLAEVEKKETEIELPLKDGSTRHILANALKTEWKGETVFQVTLHDITALYNAYTELERKNEQFYNTIEYAPVPIMLLAEDGEVLRLNRVWTSMTGYTKEAIPNVDAWVRQAFEGEVAGKKLQQIMERFMQEGPVSEGECDVTISDGRKLTWFFTSAPLGALQDGRKVVITTALDVTELHEKEEQMITQSRQAAMGDMIAMIAHQWRQPITVIAMAVNNIKLDIELDEEVTTEKIQGMIETVTEQTQHLSKTIDDFRNFFKPNKEAEEFRVNSVLESAMKIIGKSLENNNITVQSSDTSTCTLKTYPNELLQVILNIISNAKDAHKNSNRDDAFIHIEITNDEKEVLISICDNAGGIPDAVITQIGQPYFTTKKENGTGLGIYMSRTIIQKHMHGKLTWENKEEGACFYITLPLNEASA